MRILIIGSSGYIGSALLQYFVRHGVLVDSVDCVTIPDVHSSWHRSCHYRDLTAADLRLYDWIILMAGPSSVRLAEENPYEALRSGIVDFYNLLLKLTSQRLIFASSASLYSGLPYPASEVDRQVHGRRKMYDLIKFLADTIAESVEYNWYGLRLATVNGPSPRMRWDLMINTMTLMGRREGHVSIQHPTLRRPILGISDLCRAVHTLVDKEPPFGFYNLASFNSTVSEIGRDVASYLNVPIRVSEPTEPPSYDFHVSVERFCTTLHFSFKDTVRSIVDELLKLKENGA